MVKKENTNKEHILLSNVVNNPIHNISPFTLLDYPDKTACIIWFAGCNMQCQYCYNPDIIDSKGKVSCGEALSFLKSRKGLLDGVVLSGGECTNYKGLVDFVVEIKKQGFKVKLDTNGSNPHVLKKLIEGNLIDYVALDFKAPKEKFFEITKSKLFERFENSLEMLVNSLIEFEVRTTVHNSLLSKADLNGMIAFLNIKGYRNKYYIQQFVNDTATVGGLGYSKNDFSINDFDSEELELVLRN